LSDDIVKIVGNRKIKARKEPYFGMKPWSPHDLRRTACTNLARVGVSDEVGEEVMNHINARRLFGVYNKYRYDEEKNLPSRNGKFFSLKYWLPNSPNNNQVVSDKQARYPLEHHR